MGGVSVHMHQYMVNKWESILNYTGMHTLYTVLTDWIMYGLFISYFYVFDVIHFFFLMWDGCGSASTPSIDKSTLVKTHVCGPYSHLSIFPTKSTQAVSFYHFEKVLNGTGYHVACSQHLYANICLPQSWAGREQKMYACNRLKIHQKTSDPNHIWFCRGVPTEKAWMKHLMVPMTHFYTKFQWPLFFMSWSWVTPI